MNERQRHERGTVGSALLAAVSVAAAVIGVGFLGPVVAVGGLAWLVVYTLRRAGANPPPFPAPHFSLDWLREVAAFARAFTVWAAPNVPFVAPLVAFVAVTWPLAPESASMRFQEQAAQIILVLLVGYVIEAGAIRWRGRPVDWLLSLVTVLILLAGETYTLVDLATNDRSHADVIAGAMAAGVVAIGTAAIQGSAQRREAPTKGD